MKRRFCGLALTVLLLAPASAAHAATFGRPILDVPFVTTPEAVVTAMLKLAGTRPDDVVYDLGSGDGRIVIAAVRDFAVRRAVGVDLDPRRVSEARAAAAKAGLGDRVRFAQGDVFKFDFSPATVVTMYLSPRINRELRPRLSNLKPGTRIVSHSFLLGEWEPDKTVEVEEFHQIYLWVVPAQLAGHWSWDVGADHYTMELRQSFQKVTGTLHAAGREGPIADGSVTGDRLRFSVRLGETLIKFDGRLAGDSIAAALTGKATARIVARRAP